MSSQGDDAKPMTLSHHSFESGSGSFPPRRELVFEHHRCQHYCEHRFSPVLPHSFSSLTVQATSHSTQTRAQHALSVALPSTHPSHLDRSAFPSTIGSQWKLTTKERNPRGGTQRHVVSQPWELNDASSAKRSTCCPPTSEKKQARFNCQRQYTVDERLLSVDRGPAQVFTSLHFTPPLPHEL